MKVTSKPISSPGRTERFPTPLMLRFLRSNVGSKSRGRSRSSPMFLRKKNAVIEPAQEPSSPKVTCMGQVRVRRSPTSKTDRTNRPTTPSKRRRRHHSWWLSFRRALLCNHFGKLRKLRSFRPFWRRWVFFSRFVCCRKIDFALASSRSESNRRSLDKINVFEDEAQVRGNKQGFMTPSPPKNAFLLTRCRSAPYRSSSLASQFWGSPLSTTETRSTEDKIKNGIWEHQEEKEVERSNLEGDYNFKKLTLEEEKRGGGSHENLRLSKEFEEKSNGTTNEENTIDFERMAVHPLTLTRCKSEPARTGVRLNPEVSVWRQTGLEFAEPCSPT